MPDNTELENLETQRAWNANAAVWDEKMGDAGNDFVNTLIWPSAQRLLDLQPGERILDVGCGNGLYSRRLARLGSEVVAIDFAEALIERAQRYPSNFDGGGSATYHVIDATDEAALLTLGKEQFDAAFSTMALMDIADIEPLMRALSRLLKPKGRFIFAIAHPCFNQTFAAHFAEMEDRGEIITTYGVKVTGYMTANTQWGLALSNQREPQRYFNRPLHEFLQPAFNAGFVLDGLEERAFPPEYETGRNLLGWNGSFSEIPPVMVGRMRLNQSE